MRIVADTTIPFLKGVVEPSADVVYLSAKGFTPEAIKDADALIVRSIDKCTPQLLRDSKVKLITTATIGFDHIDTHYCEANGIAWRNAPGCNAPSVAQYVISSLLVLAQREGNASLKGKSIGIIGVGHVGKQVERLATLLGMRVLRNDPPRVEKEGSNGFLPLDDLLGEADIVTLHVPFTREGKYPTFHLADNIFFEKMKPGCWFVNSCRGSVHDTTALLDACRTGIVKETIIDCWENEPDIDMDLLQTSSIASPHIAGFSADGKATATRMCLEAIASFFSIHFEHLSEVVPLSPENPIIDLNDFDHHRIEQAFLRTFNPEVIDHKLRNEPSSFEYLRNHYDHPREPKAYQIAHATLEEQETLQKIGFQII